MKIPRDLSGIELIKHLKPYGYVITRQSGSHTIPYHDPLKIGTLSAILAEVASHFGITRDELIQKLFG